MGSGTAVLSLSKGGGGGVRARRVRKGLEAESVLRQTDGRWMRDAGDVAWGFSKVSPEFRHRNSTEIPTEIPKF